MATEIVNGTHPGDVMDTTEDVPLTDSEPQQSTGPSIQVHEPDKTDDDSGAKPAEIVVGTRRNANGTIGSVFSGNKIRHLKKEDGQPLWRKDIQHDFLRAIFDDKTKCFTEVDGTEGHTFSEVFIGAMQRSSKTSKVLKEKLLNEKEQAIRMAMICLLVNIGRMNTTLNFFPEMRAQLRTYHAIPCLQSDQDPNAQYKGLQDAPRLKSILKGACEDTEEPNTIEKISAGTIPRTNIVNLIFVLSQHVQKVSELHFEKRQDFFDLVIQSNVSSSSRARAFLWLMWWYMQSNFTKEDALVNNPFGAGQYSQDDPEGLPVKVPELVELNEEEEALENIDTPEELAFGEEMRVARRRILEEEDITTVKKTAGPSPARSEVGRTRENTPDGTPSASRARKANLDPSVIEAPPARIRLNVLNLARKPEGNKADGTLSGPASSGNPAANSAASLSRRSRPETSHQKAVNLNRRMHVDKILFKKWNEDAHIHMRRRKYGGLNRLYHQIKRIYYLPVGYDTDDEDNFLGSGGITPNVYTTGISEEEDFGGDAHGYKKVINRSLRRLARDSNIEYPTIENQSAGRPPQTNGTRPAATASRSRPRPSAKKVESSTVKQPEDLDDLDMDLLGEGQALNGDEQASSSGDSDDAEMTEDDFSYADPYATLK